MRHRPDQSFKTLGGLPIHFGVSNPIGFLLTEFFLPFLGTFGVNPLPTKGFGVPSTVAFPTCWGTLLTFTFFLTFRGVLGELVCLVFRPGSKHFGSLLVF